MNDKDILSSLNEWLITNQYGFKYILNDYLERQADGGIIGITPEEIKAIINLEKMSNPEAWENLDEGDEGADIEGGFSRVFQYTESRELEVSVYLYVETDEKDQTIIHYNFIVE